MITSLQAPLVKHCVKLVRDKGYREERNEVLIEGKSFINEFQGVIKHLLSVAPTAIKAEETTFITKEIAQKISPTNSPEGLFAIVNKPVYVPKPITHLLVLEGISDPGNLGTLFRTAQSFLWEEIFLIQGCDPFNDKCLRASKGAIFKIPFREGTLDDLKEILTSNQLTPLIADIFGQPFEEFLNIKKTALILGSEAKGASPEIKRNFQKITIPIEGMESLNVAIAGGILLHAFRP